jgi:RNA polymerase sigma-70 factor (ECF subfamily)
VGLAEEFIAQTGGGAIEATADLEQALRDLLEQARSAWPMVGLPDAIFLRYLAERVGEGGDLATILRTLHAADLYLACGCSQGEPRAIAAFEEHYVAQIEAHLARSDALPTFSQELKQTLRERVLVAREGLLPRISSYNGRGPLGGWLRMVAARVAVDLRRKQKNEGTRPGSFAVPLPALDPELAYLKERYRREFEAALETAFRGLSAREGTIMRLHFLEAMPVSGIATMYHVSARTVQRWIVIAQANVLAETRRVLSEKLALSGAELDSLLGLVKSELNLSFHRFLEKSNTS